MGVVSAAMGAGAITAVNAFRTIEDAQASFTPLLGSAEKAKTLVDALNETAASTPFQFENIASTAEQLLPVMNGNIAETVKTFRMLGDTAGGDVQKLDSITRGYTKALLTQKVSLESLNMISEAGVPIFAELAKVVGVDSPAALFDLISAGQVTTDQLTDTFRSMTAEGGIFFNGMDVASKTTSGILSTLQDNVTLTAATVGEILAPTVKELALVAIEYTKVAKEWIKNNEELIRSNFLVFVDTAWRLIQGLTTAVVWMVTNFETVKTATLWVVGLVTVLKTLITVMTIVNLVMTANPISLIIVGVAALITGITALVIWVEELTAGFDKLPLAVQIALAPIRLLLDLIKLAKDGIGSFLNFIGVTGPSVAATTAAALPVTTGAERSASATAAAINETRTSSVSRVVIEDPGGIASAPEGLGPGVQLARSGAF